jgi:hypothetical protein
MIGILEDSLMRGDTDRSDEDYKIQRLRKVFFSFNGKICPGTLMG